MHMNDVAVFGPRLIVSEYLVIVHQRTSVRILNFLSFMDRLDQFISNLVLELSVGHHRQVVESARRNAHALELLSGVGVDRERQLNLVRILLGLPWVATFLS